MITVRGRFFVAVLLASLLSAVLSAPASASEDETSAGFETVLRGTNDYRELNGVDRLVHDPRMTAVAQAWAERMAADFAADVNPDRSAALQDAFRHNLDMSSQVPSGWESVGENIAMNGGHSRPYDQLLEQWRNSPGHNANMLNTRWTHIGVGTYQDDSGLTWGVQVFGDYGTPSSIPDSGDAVIDLDNLTYSGAAECVVLVSEPAGSEFFRQCGTRPGNVYMFSDAPPGTYSANLLAAGGGVLYSGWPTYVGPAPAVTVVAPVSGSTDGGMVVTLTGVGFAGAMGVSFGGVAGTSLSVTSDGKLTVKAPAHAAGAVDVVVTTPSGSSPAKTLTYVPWRFSDVPVSHPFYTQVEWLATQGITNGYQDGRFGVVDRVTRGQMAAFLYKMAGSPAYTPPVSAQFPDVPVSHPFYKYVSWLAAQGITNGYGNGLFGVSDAVTRGQMSVFLYKFAGSPVYTPPVSTQFPDVPVSHPFYKYVSWLVSKHISNGYGNGNFGGSDPVTRGQMAVFLYNYAHLPG